MPFAIKRRDDDRWVRDVDRHPNDSRRYGSKSDRMTFSTREEATTLALGFEEVIPEQTKQS